MDTNTGSSPGYQSQSQQPENSPSEEVMGHWTPTGCGPKDIHIQYKYNTNFGLAFPLTLVKPICICVKRAILNKRKFD